MQSQNRFFEDLSRLANGAAGTFAGVAREMEGMVRNATERFIGGLDLVTRDEFEAVKEMAAKARAEADALRARLDAMEGVAAPSATEPVGSSEPDPTAAEARKRARKAPDEPQG